MAFFDFCIRFPLFHYFIFLIMKSSAIIMLLGFAFGILGSYLSNDQKVWKYICLALGIVLVISSLYFFLRQAAIKQ